MPDPLASKETMTKRGENPTFSNHLKYTRIVYLFDFLCSVQSLQCLDNNGARSTYTQTLAYTLNGQRLLFFSNHGVSILAKQKKVDRYTRCSLFVPLAPEGQICQGNGQCVILRPCMCHLFLGEYQICTIEQKLSYNII